MTPEDERPATRAELSQVKEDLIKRMDQMQDELIEKMRDMQTEVLRAFHSWARPVDIRLRRLDDLDQRMALLEERIFTIEQRNPPAA